MILETSRKLMLERVVEIAPSLARTQHLGDAIGAWVERLEYDEGPGQVDGNGWETRSKVEGSIVLELVPQLVEAAGDQNLVASFFARPFYCEQPEEGNEGDTAYSFGLKFRRRSDADAGQGVLVTQYQFDFKGWLWVKGPDQGPLDVMLGTAPKVGADHEADYVPVVHLDAEVQP